MKYLKMLVTAGLLFFSVTQSWAIPLTVGSSPQLFTFWGGEGWIDNPSEGYQLTTTSSVKIDLTDRLMIGDRYELYVNNTYMTTTSEHI